MISGKSDCWSCWRVGIDAGVIAQGSLNALEGQLVFVLWVRLSCCVLRVETDGDEEIVTGGLEVDQSR